MPSQFGYRCPKPSKFAGYLSPPEELHELIDCHAGVGEDAAQRAGSDLHVVGNNDPGVWIVTSQDHMAAGLAAKHKPGAFERGADLTAR
jgi:hypothetical protein